MSSTRRSFMQTAAATGIVGFSDLGFLSQLPLVSAADAKLDPKVVWLDTEIEPLVRLLEAALTQAGIATMPGEWGVAARVLYAPKSALVVVVNERPEPATRKVTVDQRSMDIAVPAFGAKITIVDRAR